MKLGFLLCSIVLLVGCTPPQSEAEVRLRRYFQLSKHADIESKPSPLLSKLPVGTAEKEVYEFLDNSGIGKDGMSSYYPAGERGDIGCRVEYDLSLPGLVKEHFGVLIRLDDDRKVKEIVVMRWLTGP